MAGVDLSRRAVLDLAAIQEYSRRQWGERVAVEHLEHFSYALARLRDNPSFLRKKRGLSMCLAFYRVVKHFLICDSIGDTVFILAVRHGSMGLPEVVARLEPPLVAEAEFLRHQLLNSRRSPLQ